MKDTIRIGIFMVLLSLSCIGVYGQQAGATTSIVTIDSKSYYVHTVKAGETIYSIATQYGVSQGDILISNPLAENGIRSGQVVKVPVPAPEDLSRSKQRKEDKLFDTHIVNKGETAYFITTRYGISVNMLIEDNPGLDPTKLSLGQTLRIRKKSQGESSAEQIKGQWVEYTQTINNVSQDYKYHLVQPGETLYSLSKTLGVPQNLIRSNNDISGGLRAGSMVKIPLRTESEAELKSVVTPPTTPLRGNQTANIADISSKRSVNVAMLLPLQVGGSSNRNYLEFYQGALLALESLKSEGININLDLFNTGKNENEVSVVVADDAFRETNLIIGPVYEDNILPVISFATERNIPVVSPLSTLTKDYGPLVYQMSPATDRKYDKLKSLLSPQNNVVLITSDMDDVEFGRDIRSSLPSNHHKIAYSRTMSSKSIANVIDNSKENVFVVLSNNEYNVDKILAILSSIQTNMVSRGMKTSTIRVVGSSRWTGFVNLDKDLYFKVRLSFITSYYAGRENEAVARFDSRYITAFGSLPTSYSYRGYDAVKLFVGAMAMAGSDFNQKLNNSNTPPLGVPYNFVRTNEEGYNVNDQWIMVNYNNNYTIELK